MRIVQAKPRDVLRSERGRHVVVGHNCNIQDELGRRVYWDGIYDEEFEQVHPGPIREGKTYVPKLVFADPTAGFKHPRFLLLVETGGACDGYRHRLPIDNYACVVPFMASSTDKRVGSFVAFWKCRSGQLWLQVEKATSCRLDWDFDKNLPTMRFDFGTRWITVPAQ